MFLDAAELKILKLRHYSYKKVPTPLLFSGREKYLLVLQIEGREGKEKGGIMKATNHRSKGKRPQKGEKRPLYSQPSETTPLQKITERHSEKDCLISKVVVQ